MGRSGWVGLAVIKPDVCTGSQGFPKVPKLLATSVAEHCDAMKSVPNNWVVAALDKNQIANHGFLMVIMKLIAMNGT